MSILVHCPRGHSIPLNAPPRRAIACPRCGVVFATDDDEGPLLPALPGAVGVRSERSRGRDDDDADDDDDRPRRRKRRDDDDDDEKVRTGPPPRRRAVPRRDEDDEPADEDDDEPVGVVLSRKQRAMANVRLGILFHIIKLCIYLAGLVFGVICLPLALFADVFFGGIWGGLLRQVTYNLSMTLAPICGIIGSILCAYVPPRSEARGLIIVSMIFDVLAPFFGLFQLIMWLGFVVTVDERVGRLIGYMFLARLACTLTAWWLVQLYLRKLAFYLRETLLASESLNVIVHLLMATVITPTLVVLIFAVLFIFGGGLFVIILFFATVGWMIFLSVTFPYRQFHLLFTMRQKIFDKFLKPDDDD
jgi:hypothetical protein